MPTIKASRTQTCRLLLASTVIGLASLSNAYLIIHADVCVARGHTEVSISTLQLFEHFVFMTIFRGK